MTLAEIVADIERQARNYGTVILPTDDAMRLRAVARAAVEYDMLVQEWLGMAPLQTGRTGVAIRMDVARERLHALVSADQEGAT